MSRNSIALITELRGEVSKSEEALRIEERKVEWIMNWKGVSETYAEPQNITWENVEELERLKWDCEARIASLEGNIIEGKELIARLNAFF